MSYFYFRLYLFLISLDDIYFSELASLNFCKNYSLSSEIAYRNYITSLELQKLSQSRRKALQLQIEADKIKRERQSLERQNKIQEEINKIKKENEEIRKRLMSSSKESRINEQDQSNKGIKHSEENESKEPFSKSIYQSRTDSDNQYQKLKKSRRQEDQTQIEKQKKVLAEQQQHISKIQQEMKELELTFQKIKQRTLEANQEEKEVMDQLDKQLYGLQKQLGVVKMHRIYHKENKDRLQKELHLLQL